MAPCGKPAAAVAGASAGAVAAPAPGVKRDSTLEVMVASMVGTAIEFYDNYCYSIAAASYFGLIFFTDVAKSDPVLATLLRSSRSPSASWPVRSAACCSDTSAIAWVARKPWSQP